MMIKPLPFVAILLIACASSQNISAASAISKSDRESSNSIRCARTEGDRLSACMAEGFRQAISKCWNGAALIGATDYESLVVEVQFELDTSGKLIGEPRVLPSAAPADTPYLQVAQDVAVKAVTACQPYDFLPSAHYDLWKEIQLNFDPRLMAIN